MASIANRHTARSGPPWCSRLRCASPSRPNRVILAVATARFGTPPFETLSCTMRPTSLTASPPPNHSLDPRLEHEIVPLIQDPVAVGDDAPVRLLGLALVDYLDLHADRIALEHRRHDAQLPSEPRHAGAVDEPRLHDEALREGEGERARCGAPCEHRLALDVLHVDEQRLDEAAEVDEVDDVGLRDGARERAVHGAYLVAVVVDPIASHGVILPDKRAALARSRRAVRRCPRARPIRSPVRSRGARWTGPWRRSARRAESSCPAG